MKPKSVAFSQDGRFAAVASAHNVRPDDAARASGGVLSVHRYDAARGVIETEALAELREPGAPLANVEMCAFIPRARCGPYRILVADQGRDVVNAFDFEAEARTIVFRGVFAAGLSFPHGVDVSAAGMYAAITNYGDDTLRIARIAPLESSADVARRAWTGVHGCIDEPAAGATVAEDRLRIRGWAFAAPAPVWRIDLTLGGVALGTAGLGRPRPDVAAFLGDDDAGLAGFEARVAAARLGGLGGRAQLRVAVTTADGTRSELAPVEVVIASRAEAPQTPPSLDPIPSSPPRPTRRSGAPIRILWLARDLGRGGSQLRMRELLEHLASQGGFENTVLSPVDGPLSAALRTAGVALEVIGPIPFDDASAYEAKLSALAAWAAGRFDLAVGATISSFPAVDLARRLGLPSLLRCGEVEPIRTVFEWLGLDLDASVESAARRAIEAASAVVCVSEASRQSLAAAGLTGRFTVLKTGVDLDGARKYAERYDQQACRQILGLPQDGRIVINASTIWPVKGQTVLAWALRHLREKHPRLHCILIGEADPAYACALSAFIARNGLSRAVSILPFEDDLRPWWRAADAAVFASESEGLCASALEAMAFGLPVLGCRVGGLPELIAPGVTGWLCEPNDVASLATGLDRLACAGAEELRGLGQAGQALVAADHDRRMALGRTTELLRRLADSPAHRA